MAFIDRSHLSPNHSSRGGAHITMLVAHATVGGMASSLDWLTNQASGVSSNYLISKTGHINQLVLDERAAWHAGKSAWRGLDGAQIQAQSVSVELENLTGMVDPHTGAIHPPDPYPQAQYAAFLALAQLLVVKYRITPDMVVRHLDIALPKGRKTDPAGFPWAQFKADLYAGLRVQRYTVKVSSVFVNIRVNPTSDSTILGRIWAMQPAWGVEVPGQEVRGDARWLRLWGRPAGFAWCGALKLSE